MGLLLCLLDGAPLTVAVVKTIALLAGTQGTHSDRSFGSHLAFNGFKIQ